MTSPPPLPFAHLNLTRNPFGELETDDWVQAALLNLDTYVEWLVNPKRCVQFCGDKGRGKTTHLLALQQRLSAAVYTHVLPGESLRGPIAATMLIDEFQNVGWWQRRRVYRNATRLVLGSHRDHEREAQRYGFEVKKVELPLSVDQKFLTRLVANRCELFRRTAGELPFLDQQGADWLLQHHGSNLRAMIHECYRGVQRLEQPGPIPLPPHPLP